MNLHRIVSQTCAYWREDAEEKPMLAPVGSPKTDNDDDIEYRDRLHASLAPDQRTIYWQIGAILQSIRTQIRKEGATTTNFKAKKIARLYS